MSIEYTAASLENPRRLRRRELMAVTGMVNKTDRLANSYRILVDPAFDK